MHIRLTAATFVALAGITLAACGTPQSAGTSSGGGDAAADGTPIKVAVIPPSSGALAQFGQDAAAAWQFAVDEVNAAGGIDGRQVELIKLDTDAKPETTLRAAREAVNQHGAHFIGAVMTSTEHGALNAQLAGLGALSFNALGKDDALTGKDCNANAFRVVQSVSMDVRMMAGGMPELPASAWDIQAVDYSTGHTSASAFKEAATAEGKTIGVEQYAPLNTSEFGTYITTLQGSPSDGLLAVEYGADGVAFVNQMAQFNLGSKYKAVLGFNMVSEPLFKTLGNKVLGYYNNVGYDAKLDNTLNTKFVTDWKAKSGSRPYYVVADNYLAAQMLFEGIKKAGSDDPEKVKEALNDLTFDSIVGEVTMRAGDHQLIRDSYLGQVVEDPEGTEGMGWDMVYTGKGADIIGEVSSECQMG